jgi:hypothetical protein
MSLRLEEIDHINLVNWFDETFPELSDDFHHFANERKCSVMEGRKLKKMGVKRGVADFFLAIPLNNKAGLWIELKVGKNKPSKEQLAFAERKIMRHYQFAFIWGFEAAKEIILSYLKPLLSKREGIMLISFI